MLQEYEYLMRTERYHDDEERKIPPTMMMVLLYHHLLLLLLVDDLVQKLLIHEISLFTTLVVRYDTN
jgi:hypothetical protein